MLYLSFSRIARRLCVGVCVYVLVHAGDMHNMLSLLCLRAAVSQKQQAENQLLHLLRVHEEEKSASILYLFPPFLSWWEALTESGENRRDWSVAYRPRNDSLSLMVFYWDSLFYFPFLSVIFTLSFLGSKPRIEKENINLQMRKGEQQQQNSSVGRARRKKGASRPRVFGFPPLLQRKKKKKKKKGGRRWMAGTLVPGHRARSAISWQSGRSSIDQQLWLAIPGSHPSRLVPCTHPGKPHPQFDWLVVEDSLLFFLFYLIFIGLFFSSSSFPCCCWCVVSLRVPVVPPVYWFRHSILL